MDHIDMDIAAMDAKGFVNRRVGQGCCRREPGVYTARGNHLIELSSRYALHALSVDGTSEILRPQNRVRWNWHTALNFCLLRTKLCLPANLWQLGVRIQSSRQK